MQIALLGLSIVQGLADRLGSGMHSHVDAVLPPIVARLADTKDMVQ